MSDISPNIVEADLADINHTTALVSLLEEYASSMEGGGKGLSAYSKAHLTEELSRRPHAHAIIAWINDQPAGLIIAFEGFSTFQCKPLLNIHDVIVSKKFRGLGLSKKLLMGAEVLARGLGCCKLTLEVLEHNEIAQKAYRSVGYSGYELDPRMGKALFWEKPL
jgi:ribosomal protein S18 acetylase RimI-like enzyme